MAHGDCGLSLRDGLAIEPISPRTIARSIIYGIHNSPVRMTVSVSHVSSLDIAIPFDLPVRHPSVDVSRSPNQPHAAMRSLRVFSQYATIFPVCERWGAQC